MSPTPVAVLKARLPVQILESVSASFDITTYTGQNPKLRSVITVVCAGDHKPLQILAAYQAELGHYSVVVVEVALDVVAGVAWTAREGLSALVGQLVKPRQRRRHLRVEHKPDRNPPPGCVREPTFYFEDRKSSVKQKAYVRHRKLRNRRFGEEHVRIEWTLTHKRAIARHLGGNKIDNLLVADLDNFIERNLRLEQVDHVVLGYVLRGIPANRRRRQRPRVLGNKNKVSILEQYRDPDYRARRVAFLALRVHAFREESKFASPEQALWVCQNSPAQIRGYLKELRDGTRPRRRGRPKNIPPRKRRITDYQIDRCFRRIKPVRV